MGVISPELVVVWECQCLLLSRDLAIGDQVPEGGRQKRKGLTKQVSLPELPLIAMKPPLLNLVCFPFPPFHHNTTGRRMGRKPSISLARTMSTASHAESTSIAQSSHLNVLMVGKDRGTSSNSSSKSSNDGGSHAGRGGKSKLGILSGSAKETKSGSSKETKDSAQKVLPGTAVMKRHLSIQFEDVAKASDSEDDEEEEVEAVTTRTDLSLGVIGNIRNSMNLKSNISAAGAAEKDLSPGMAPRTSSRSVDVRPSLPLDLSKMIGSSDKKKPASKPTIELTSGSSRQGDGDGEKEHAMYQIPVLNPFQQELREKENTASIESYIEQICNIYTYNQERNIDEKVISDSDDPPQSFEWILACFPGGRFSFERDFPNARILFNPESDWRLAW